MRARLLAFSALGACACASVPPPPPATVPVVEMSLAEAGLDEKAIDPSADPCQDFYQFACGGWVARTELPADKANYIRSFSGIGDRNQADLRALLEKAAASPGDRLGSYYASCMDEPAIEKAALAPVAPLLALAAGVTDLRTLSAAVSELHLNAIPVFWSFGSVTDAKDATQVIAGLFQGGLGLPDRDYYTRTDEDSRKLLAFYQEHVAVLLGFSGMSPAAARKAARDVVAFETEIAKVSKTDVELRDPVKLYNRVDREGLRRAAPHLDWDAYFAGLGISDVKPVTASSVEFVQGIDRILAATPMPVIRAYLTYNVLEGTAELLGAELQAAHFALVQALMGQKENEARWKRCVKSTDRSLGMLLAQAYVNDHFAGDSRDKAEALVKDIAAAMDANLGVLEWMDDATLARAKDKLHKMTYQIGYPDKWRDYDFAIDASSYAENALAGRRFELRRDLGKIGKPVDKSDWIMTPPTVNAFYASDWNGMVFPAGILQSPFFDRKSAVAVNFGAIGTVMGHELTHGFDDQGAQFDGDGNLHDWWSPSVGAKFKERTACVADQYSQYEAVPGVKVNGELTKGENIADIGGLKLAFAAYRKERANAKERIRAGSLNEDQLFYLAFAQSWCTNARPEYLRMQAQIDEHSASRWRVNGTVSDEPEFAQAFQCKLGTTMHPAHACAVW